jgi:hypothetical protein
MRNSTPLDGSSGARSTAACGLEWIPNLSALPPPQERRKSSRAP